MNTRYEFWNLVPKCVGGLFRIGTVQNSAWLNTNHVFFYYILYELRFGGMSLKICLRTSSDFTRGVLTEFFDVKSLLLWVSTGSFPKYLYRSISMWISILVYEHRLENRAKSTLLEFRTKTTGSRPGNASSDSRDNYDGKFPACVASSGPDGRQRKADSLHGAFL